jgi:hypothetical protein
MKIRWTFFFEEGNVCSETVEEKEDKRIQNAVENQIKKPIIFFPNKEIAMYVNFTKVKLISRQEINDNPETEPSPSSTNDCGA